MKKSVAEMYPFERRHNRLTIRAAVYLRESLQTSVRNEVPE